MEPNSSNCLTYEQLTAFAKGTMHEREYVFLQKHLVGCELCGYAVKGFELSPVSLIDISDVDKRIEKRAPARVITSKDFKYIGMAGAAILMIYSFYNFAGSFALKQKVLPQKTIEISMSTVENKEENSFNEVIVPTKNRKRVAKQVETEQRSKRELYELFPLQLVKPLIGEATQDTVETQLPPVFMAEAVYICNLKVANYFELYFKISGKKTVGFNNHIPSSSENKGQKNHFDRDIVNTTTLESILKRGLFYFNEEEYVNSINQFRELLAYSPNDINALFYMAMAYSKTGDYDRAAKNFDKVLEHSDKTFVDEAKWHLALVYIAAYETGKATELLEEIATQKGFYAKNAEKKLYGIKNE